MLEVDGRLYPFPIPALGEHLYNDDESKEQPHASGPWSANLCVSLSIAFYFQAESARFP